ncbi:shikimate dehydrogenase [Oscillatoria sp. FACHB-1407]|uniref:shikimate dehydrogenase n=1 Tax=Oscillatoria sp. FACHB-1407 TaxID=2692847 RepID=UPI0016867100|nr:shikimate dehydrogenase [Oscillatoria sp. FACHB-1407]MBD2464189.1 shikimate dehydrogenase [Oscillatoria sp. FACHB-1407]
MILGTTKLLGVVGYPVAHSLSPVMHNAAIAQLGADYIYLPFPVAPDQLKPAIAGFQAIGVQGFNVTIPHKQTVMPLLSGISEVAQVIGAVNTVAWTDQGWWGTNTDVIGFMAPLKAMNRDWQGAIALVLGNGGSARAVVAGCAQLGCADTWVVGRDPKKLEAFHASWQDSTLVPRLSVYPWSELPVLLPQASLVVNTTPIGMHPKVEETPLSQAEIESLQPGAIAYDLIYTPRPTQFLQLAQSRGAIACDGLEMLVQQGAAALELWLQQPVPVDTMRQSLLEQLQGK